jgi:hypothetical protein
MPVETRTEATRYLIITLHANESLLPEVEPIGWVTVSAAYLAELVKSRILSEVFDEFPIVFNPYETVVPASTRVPFRRYLHTVLTANHFD